jgi:hypothetical protein
MQNLILLTLASLNLLLSCAKETTSSSLLTTNTTLTAPTTQEIPEIDADQFVDEIVLRKGLPQAGETVSFEIPKFLSLAGSDKQECLYIAKFKVTAIEKAQDKLVFSIDPTSTASSKNPAGCPAQFDSKSKYTETFTIQNYLNSKKEFLKEVFSAKVFCEQYTKTCKSAKITRLTRDVNDFGVAAVYVEMEYETQLGNRYLIKSWVSQDSLLMGNYDFEITNIDTGKWVDFKEFLSYSLN